MPLCNHRAESTSDDAMNEPVHKRAAREKKICLVHTLAK